MDDVLIRSLEAGVLNLTMNRPERLNALTIPLMRTLEETLREAAVDPDVHVVVLRGAGTGFCSGGDMREGRKDDRAGDRPRTDPGYHRIEQRYDRLRRFVEAPALLHRMAKPTVAVVRGAATGAGFALAAACDFRLLSETAFFMTSFARGGFSGDFGGSYFITRLLGTAKARELYMLNPRVTAADARGLGLATEVLADGELDARADAFASALAAGPRVAFRYMKQNLNTAETGTLDQLLDQETLAMVRSGETDDQKEAVKAMMEKRPAQYRGY